MTNTGDSDDPFKVWAASTSTNPTHFGLTGATLKLGPRVCKTVSFATFGDGATGEIKKRELRVAKFDRDSDGNFDFAHPGTTWSIEDDEIERLLSFLNQDVDQPGLYKVVRVDSPAGEMLQVLGDTPDAVYDVIQALGAQADPQLVGIALSTSESGVSAAEVAVLQSRRGLVEVALERCATDDVTETDMQRLIGSAWWLFGGRYVGRLSRADLLQLDQHDIPLITSDGALHIVELKGPRIPSLVRKHRNHWIVGNDVHEATMQATNYIRSADEQALGVQTLVREELGIDIGLRRVSATVVIGHRDHVVAKDLPEGQLELALRTYNSALARVQVVTYDELLEGAQRSLDFRPL